MEKFAKFNVPDRHSLILSTKSIQWSKEDIQGWQYRDTGHSLSYFSAKENHMQALSSHTDRSWPNDADQEDSDKEPL